MNKKSALVIVDLQNDFCPGGTLGVAGGDEIIPAINQAIDHFASRGMPVIASRDWHPEKTSHFVNFGGLWPPHCIQGSTGASFHPMLRLPPEAIIISKGTDPAHDDYSAFHAKDREGRTLADILSLHGIANIHVCGLATDYCVKETVLEGKRRGFDITVFADAIKGVDLSSGASEKAIHEMIQAGAAFVAVADLDLQPVLR